MKSLKNHNIKIKKVHNKNIKEFFINLDIKITL